MTEFPQIKQRYARKARDWSDDKLDRQIENMEFYDSLYDIGPELESKREALVEERERRE